MREDSNNTAPLNGVRVVEFGSAILGPYTSQQLGDYGAEVIKVEPLEGDPTRYMGPSRESGMAATFLGVNRGKQSIALNMKKPEAKEILRRLLDTSDVFLHNMRAKKAAQLGLSPEVLLKAHPRLVVAGLLGFLANGPYSDHPAYDDVIQGLSGVAGLAAEGGGAPAYFPTCIADKTTSNIAVQAILAALFRRERTGLGASVEVPMFETMVSYVLVEHLGGYQFEPPEGGIGYERYLARSHRPLRTQDSYVCVRPLTDAHWNALFAAIGDEEAACDARFSTVASRSKHTDAVFERVERHVEKFSTQACLELFERLDIPASRVSGLRDLMSDPHLDAVGHFDRVHDDAMGTLVYPASGPRFDGARQHASIPPRLGEHTRAVLRHINYDEDAIDRLVDAGVLYERLGTQ